MWCENIFQLIGMMSHCDASAISVAYVRPLTKRNQEVNGVHIICGQLRVSSEIHAFVYLRPAVY